MKMKTLRYRVKFITPAFLGNAFQKGQWRVPPFKALLRQWWRVAYAHEVDYNWKELHGIEARIFGAASDDGNGGTAKSLISMRLSDWNESTTNKWTFKDARVAHPEVGSGGMKIGSHLYLGYGPLEYSKGTAVKGTKDSEPISFVVPHSSADITIMCRNRINGLEDTLKLMQWFGTIGGRSRNGWGSFLLSPIDGTENIPNLPSSKNELEKECGDILQPLKDCLKLDWPHAIGMDKKGPLVWKTEPKSSWEEVMKDLAEIKIAFRTTFPFTGSSMPEERHILAYPVTNHNVLGNSDRLANQLRFKVIQEDVKYAGLIYHLPAKCPLPNTAHINQQAVWETTHNILDSRAKRI